MSIYQTSLDDLALLMSASAGVSILSTHFTVLGMVPTPAGESPYNTKIRVRFKTPSIYVGDKTFYYDRLDLGDLKNLRPFAGERIKGMAGPGTSLYILFPALRDGLGINFAQTDLVETFAAADDVAVTIQLTAQPASLGWIGSYALPMTGYPNISEAFISPHILGF